MVVHNSNYYHNTSSSAFDPKSSAWFHSYYFFHRVEATELGKNTLRQFLFGKQTQRD